MYTCVEQETQTQSKSPIPESFTSCQDDGKHYVRRNLANAASISARDACRPSA
jgi:hypothetical protein